MSRSTTWLARTGLSAGTIKRRLALNGPCAEAANALREGILTLSHAEALTLGAAEAQRQILEEIARGYQCDAESIRAHFLDDRPNVAMAIFPRERYTGSLTPTCSSPRKPATSTTPTGS